MAEDKQVQIESQDWKGPGYYGPIESGGRIVMVKVARWFVDAESFDRAKRRVGVLTVRYFPDPYTCGSFKEGMLPTTRF